MSGDSDVTNSFTQLGISHDDTSSSSLDQFPRNLGQQAPTSEKFSLKKLTEVQTTKFMENFDPERSNRERKKLNRKSATQGGKKATLYDENGLFGAAQKDICDCLEEACPGCHFPCVKCRSNKCGHECRQNRRYLYEEIFIEGTEVTITNPLFTK